MCIPILLETAHPRARKPLRLSKSLPWSKCHHPTCYDVLTGFLTAKNSPFGKKTRTMRPMTLGLYFSKISITNVPSSDEPEEDDTFMPILRINPDLSTVKEISESSKLYDDYDMFRDIVREYQMMRYGALPVTRKPAERGGYQASGRHTD
ncbi:hypothetical protein DFS33DRAFT_352767 [Desarmillaria ectypa]|nr:hypothetical protein DFS33DRAFT_352767 [Desarmillaria ectypa]